jgi:glycosyltransferase involved in cell wall biosynthesis
LSDIRTLVLTDAHLDEHETEARAGDRPGLRPYGMERLEELGYSLRSVPMNPGGRLATALEHRTGRRFARAVAAHGVARRSDLVLAVLEQWAWAPGMLRRVPGSGYGRTKLVGVACWAAEELSSGDEQRRRQASALLGRCDLVAFWSTNQTEIFREHGFAAERLVPLTFGVGTAYFSRDPAGERDLDVLAVGVDRGRDYATLAAAMTGSAVRVEVVTRPDSLAGIDLPANVHVRGPVSPRAYADLLRRARVVVVPTHDLAYPSGQTVALEAAASGAAVVVSSTAAMREYFADGSTALMPPVGDPGALRHAIESLVADEELRLRVARAGHAHVLAHHDSARMWTELDEALKDRRLLP